MSGTQVQQGSVHTLSKLAPVFKDSTSPKWWDYYKDLDYYLETQLPQLVAHVDDHLGVKH